MKKFDFYTSDGVLLSGIANEPKEVTKRILCLHMMPAEKESYLAFMEKVEPLGWLCHAIDFRGHGGSTKQGDEILDYHDFTAEGHKKYMIDASESLSMLREGKAVDAIIGASIGANVALRLQEQESVPYAVLLSPGTDYHGVTTLDVAGRLVSSQSVYIIATKEDERAAGNAAVMAQEIFEVISTTKKKIDIYGGSKHGTDILDGYGERMDKVIEFLQGK